ncbi:hypothetical protein OSB04_024270 [Centaurea solstitialis]|uniref:Uncharacterized protein n=1 Tax=Centaurea solstitialis TaxID=347529 RepID=A0AA38STA9_9ASTR|nr:hypothetical protein OSB04_024270 [Centaurea solstitialis]
MLEQGTTGAVEKFVEAIKNSPIRPLCLVTLGILCMSTTWQSFDLVEYPSIDPRLGSGIQPTMGRFQEAADKRVLSKERSVEA